MTEAALKFMAEYFAAEVVGKQTHFFGIEVHKCPLDLWVYQEIIVDTRPDLIVECGTYQGGSALWMASVLHQLGYGRVLSIDTSLSRSLPQHPRIEYFEGSSITTQAMAAVALRYIDAERVMVVLDSDHDKEHVLRELKLYGLMVSLGCYLIVEDTFIGHPVFPERLPGPAEALAEWLPSHPEFEVDRSREKFGMTFNPGGYLRRV